MRQQAPYDVGTDEAGSTEDEHAHGMIVAPTKLNP
jgi:hypothetical protein